MSLPETIAKLLDPAAYPHPAAAVRLIETHISWVFIAGDYAYKVKKPVDYGFLDFSTLEKRRVCCAEEIRLNRRLAPDIYLDVVAVTDAGLGEGVPLDWAVRMRAFPADATLDREAQVTPAQIDAIADRVASFHAEIERAPEGSEYGTPDKVMYPVRENFRQIKGFLPSPARGGVGGRDGEFVEHAPRPSSGSGLPAGMRPARERTTYQYGEPASLTPALSRGERAQISALETWSEAEFLRLQPHFATRKATGFIRECHGDLHLGNIAWVEGAPLIFDCIEFNPNLRFVDVVSEAAFFCMDLIARGLEPLAWRFLNRWLEHTGDYAGLAGLRYYMVYRALVRAKVAGLRAGQGDTGAWPEVSRYLALAERLCRPAGALLILMHGYSGSGKTWLSQRLLEALGAIRLRSDVERKRLHNLSALADSRVAGDIYTPEATQRTFAHLGGLADALLAEDYPVVVDATFLGAGQRSVFEALARNRSVPWRIVSLVADLARLQRQVTERQANGGDASEADLAVLASQIDHADPLSEEETAHRIAVPAGSDDQVASLALGKLQSPRADPAGANSSLRNAAN